MYRKTLRAALAIMVIALALLGVGNSSPVHAQVQVNQAFLLAYYNLINLKQYQAAYAFWSAPPQTYDNFAAGYQDTVAVLPYVGDFQPYPQSSMVGGEAGRFPGVMIGYHTDGSVVSYYGCWVVGQDARTGTGALLLNANFTLLAD